MIEFERKDKIATVTLCRTPVNAINGEWIKRFGEILDELESDRGISVLRIRSALRVFCAGFDIGLIRQHLETGAGPAAQIDDTRKLQDVFFRIERLPQVTIAQINGAALGGGLEMGLSCDLRIAAEEAVMGLPEAKLGQVPGAGGTQRLTRLCGPGTASRIILACESVNGRQAEALGIVQWSVPGVQLESEAAALAGRVAALPGETLAAGKACIAVQSERGRTGFDMERQMNLRLLGTNETRSCIAAFFDRPKR
jgi:enoyl-CoA hydratase